MSTEATSWFLDPEAPSPARRAPPPDEGAAEAVDIDVSEFAAGSRLRRALPAIGGLAGGLAALGLFALGFSRPQSAEAAQRVAVQPVAAAPVAARPTPPPAPVVTEKVVIAAPVPIAVEAAPTPEPAVPAAQVEQPEAIKAPRTALYAPSASASAARASRAAARLRAAALAFQAGRFGRAIVLYSAAAELAPKDADAHFGIALASAELFDDREARRALHVALKLDPAHAQANLLAGFIAQAHGKAEQATGYYRRYLELEPEGAYAGEIRSVLAAK